MDDGETDVITVGQDPLRTRQAPLSGSHLSYRCISVIVFDDIFVYIPTIQSILHQIQ